MIVGHLLQRAESFSSLFGGSVPDVPSLQAELDRLWTMGFDPLGREQLGCSVSGSKKWIGTSEACVLLRGQGVRCNIVAFSSILQGESAASAVIEAVRKHFSRACPRDGGVRQCNVALSTAIPLYLQHNGHSRTVVGFQRRRTAKGHEDFLLVLDPGMRDFEAFKACAERGKGWQRFVKRSLAPLEKKQEYELLIVEPDALKPEGFGSVAKDI